MIACVCAARAVMLPTMIEELHVVQIEYQTRVHTYITIYYTVIYTHVLIAPRRVCVSS